MLDVVSYGRFGKAAAAAENRTRALEVSSATPYLPSYHGGYN